MVRDLWARIEDCIYWHFSTFRILFQCVHRGGIRNLESKAVLDSIPEPLSRVLEWDREKMFAAIELSDANAFSRVDDLMAGN